MNERFSFRFLQNNYANVDLIVDIAVSQKVDGELLFMLRIVSADFRMLDTLYVHMCVD
jgi:hypothetical protein